jgi:hypothetical protein
MTTMTKEQVAKDFAEAFEIATRTNGETFYRLKDGSPKWMTDAVWAAHNRGDMLPDDTRYAMIAEVADVLANTDPDNWSDTHEDLDGLVDPYNGALLKWVASHLSRAVYVDEAISEYGWPGDLFKALAQGQYVEYTEIAASLVASLSDQFERVS